MFFIFTISQITAYLLKPFSTTHALNIIRMSASRNMKSVSNSANVARIPCCKVCKDSGEPENVYSSHYVKDRDGRVCCPKLLKIQCLRCGKNGHTSGYCTIPEATIKAQTKPVVVVAPQPKKAVESRSSRFACLDDSSDSEDDEKLLERKRAKVAAIPRSATAATTANPPTNTRWNNAKPAITVQEPISKINIENTTEFPSLGGSKSSVATPSVQVSYVSMVAKPVPPKPERSDIVIPTIKVQQKTRYQGLTTDCDWACPPAHEDDSSDDDDYEYSYYSGGAMEIEDY